ncbi:predicted protein [Naegleria gruberi]|uniref:Predicted protein n=1 Tax=Naegleria gruberi TaxID=5762 RepID=D2VH31_NAEGR|nr:uncharacterized protein NAEGRDRAFT_68258 [Naegleria gruberi]EFC43819.1 predicted protein [Naegleria gruberi]|eukprot:XP_002676563.1 predicted protein [Naegleria gruberi strain NEG-M]
MVVLTKLKHPRSQFKPPLKDSNNGSSSTTSSKSTTTDTTSKIASSLKQQTLNFPTKSSLEKQSLESSYESSESLSSPSSSDEETQDKKSIVNNVKKNINSTKPLSTSNTTTTSAPIRKPFKTPFKTPFKDNVKSSSSNSVPSTSSTSKPSTTKSKPLPQKKSNTHTKEKYDSESVTSSDESDSPSEEDEEQSSEDEQETKKKPITSTPQKKPLLLKKAISKTEPTPRTNIVNMKSSNEKPSSKVFESVQPTEVEKPNSQECKKQQASENKLKDKKDENNNHSEETQSKVASAQSSSLSLSLENEMDKQTQNKTSQISVDKTKHSTAAEEPLILEISDSSMSPLLKDSPPKSKAKKKKNITFKAIESPPTQIEITDSILYEDIFTSKKNPMEDEPKWKLKKKQEIREEHVPRQIKISKFFKKEAHDESEMKPISSVNRSVNLSKKRKEKSTPVQNSPSVTTPISTIKSPEMKKVKPISQTTYTMKTDTPEKLDQPTPKLYAMDISPVTSILSILDSQDSQCSPPVILSKPKQEIIEEEEVDEASRESLLPWSQSSQIEDSQMITFSPVYNLKSDETQIDEDTRAQKKSSMSLSPLIDIIGSNNSQQVIVLDFDETQIPDTPTHKINIPYLDDVKMKEEGEEFDEESTSIDFSEKVSITPPLTNTSKKDYHVGFLTLPYSIDLGATIHDTELPTVNIFPSDNHITNPSTLQQQWNVQPKKPIKAKAFGRRQKVSFRPVFKEPIVDEDVKPKQKVDESVMNIIASHIESQNQPRSDSSNSLSDLNNNDVLRTPPSFSSPELSL